MKPTETTQKPPQGTNIIWHHATIKRIHRQRQNGHSSVLVWFTGLSGSGKSTIAHAVEEKLYEMGCRTYVLDGDNVRHGLCGDLGFSVEDRRENIRRIGEMAKLFVDAGLIVLTAFISPFRASRNMVRSMLMPGDFLEIYCKCPLEICEQRDPKQLYQKARLGLLQEFTGISSPYEEPLTPELTLDTSQLSVEQSVSAVIALLRERGVIAS